MLQIMHVMKSSIEYITSISVNFPELKLFFSYVIFLVIAKITILA